MDVFKSKVGTKVRSSEKFFRLCRKPKLISIFVQFLFRNRPLPLVADVVGVVGGVVVGVVGGVVVGVADVVGGVDVVVVGVVGGVVVRRGKLRSRPMPEFLSILNFSFA